MKLYEKIDYLYCNCINKDIYIDYDENDESFNIQLNDDDNIYHINDDDIVYKLTIENEYIELNNDEINELNKQIELKE